MGYFSEDWNARGWSYALKGRSLTGRIINEDLSVTLDASGKAAVGLLGESLFHMSRRSLEHIDAREYITGSWNLWLQSKPSFAGTLTFYENSNAHVEYSNGWSAWWNFELHGHKISGVIPGQGVSTVTFTPDGTVGVASIGNSLFDIWRGSDE